MIFKSAITKTAFQTFTNFHKKALWFLKPYNMGTRPCIIYSFVLIFAAIKEHKTIVINTVRIHWQYKGHKLRCPVCFVHGRRMEPTITHLKRNEEYKLMSFLFFFINSNFWYRAILSSPEHPPLCLPLDDCLKHTQFKHHYLYSHILFIKEKVSVTK